MSKCDSQVHEVSEGLYYLAPTICTEMADV